MIMIITFVVIVIRVIIIITISIRQLAPYILPIILVTNVGVSGCRYWSVSNYRDDPSIVLNKLSSAKIPKRLTSNMDIVQDSKEVTSDIYFQNLSQFPLFNFFIFLLKAFIAKNSVQIEEVT